MRRPASTHSRYGIVLLLSLLSFFVVARITYLSTRSDASLLNRDPSSDRLENFPKTILWAWERPENLTFINPADVGVAFLARTIYLRGSEIIVRPRFPKSAWTKKTPYCF